MSELGNLYSNILSPTRRQTEHHGSDVNLKPSTVDGLPLFRNGGVGRRDGCVQRTIDFVKQVPSFHCFLAALALLFTALVLGACLASSNERVVELSAGMEDSRQTLEHQAGQCSEAIAGLDERLSEKQYEVAELKRNCTSLEEENGDLLEEIRSLEISNIKLMKLVDKLQEDVAAFQANHTEILKEVSMMNGKVVQQLDDKLEEEHELLLRFAAFSEQFEIKHELVSITRSDRNSTNSQAQPGPHPSTNANQVPNTESMDKEWTMHSLIDSSKVGGNETDEAQTGTVSEIKDTLHGDGASNNSTQQLAESRDMSANEDTGASTSASFGGSNMTTINGNKQSQGSGAMQSSTHSHKHAPGGGDETDASPEPDGDKGN